LSICPRMHGRAVSGVHDQPIGADQGFVKVWQAALLSILLTHEKINQDRINMLNSWKHSGFSIVSSTRILGEPDREALGQYIVRGATSTEKISYDSKTDTVTWTASFKGFYKGKKEYFRSFEFMDQLMAHLPPRRVQLVRRYGVYAGRVRSKWKDRPKLAHFATDCWHEQHGINSSTDSPTEVEQDLQDDVWSRLRKQSWARLLQKVYEVDPFVCPKCQGTMAVIAIIEEENELDKIIAWKLKQPQKTESVRAPPETANT
jgi:hypothetical protein